MMNKYLTWLLKIPLTRWAFITTTIFAILLAYNLANITWLIAPQPILTANTPINSTLGNQTIVPSTVTNISRFHLFGQYKAPVKPTVVSRPKPVQTLPPLNLKLHGVVTGSVDMARAIIAQSNGEQEIYSIGDKNLPGNATLTAIYSDKVLVERQGQIQELILIDSETLALDTPIEITEPSVKTNSTIVRTSNNTSNISSTNNEIPTDSRKESIIEVKRRLEENPASLADLLRIETVMAKGKLMGVRLRPRGQGIKIFKDFGLNPGEIIVQVNGIRLDNQQQAAQAMALLTDADALAVLDLVVLRNGQELPIYIDLSVP